MMDFDIKPMKALPFRVVRKLSAAKNDEERSEMMFDVFFNDALRSDEDRAAFDELPIADAMQKIEAWASEDAAAGK